MAEHIPVINFNNIESGLYTQVWDAPAVPDYLWREAQAVHHQDLLAELRHHNLHQATETVHIGDLPAYRDSRVDPNILVGAEFRDHQLFRRPTLALTFDNANKIVGGVYMAENTSSTLSRFSISDYLQGDLIEKVFDLEMKVKMAIPPRLNIPLLGRKIYPHLREIYTNPYSQEALNLGDDEPVVSAIALLGVYHSLLFKDVHQTVAGYQYPDEPIDRGNINTQNALGMKLDEGEPKPNKAGIYQIRATTGVKAIVESLVENERMAELIARSSVKRLPIAAKKVFLELAKNSLAKRIEDSASDGLY
jgi:hypothetical protein